MDSSPHPCRDGASIGNLRSPLWIAYTRLREQGLDPKVLLGGLKSISTPPYSSLLEKPLTIPYATVQPTAHNSTESLQSGSDTESFQNDLEEVRPEVSSLPLR